MNLRELRLDLASESSLQCGSLDYDLIESVSSWDLDSKWNSYLKLSFLFGISCQQSHCCHGSSTRGWCRYCSPWSWLDAYQFHYRWLNAIWSRDLLLQQTFLSLLSVGNRLDCHSRPLPTLGYSYESTASKCYRWSHYCYGSVDEIPDSYRSLCECCLIGPGPRLPLADSQCDSLIPKTCLSTKIADSKAC